MKRDFTNKAERMVTQKAMTSSQDHVSEKLIMEAQVRENMALNAMQPTARA